MPPKNFKRKEQARAAIIKSFHVAEKRKREEESIIISSPDDRDFTRTELMSFLGLGLSDSDDTEIEASSSSSPSSSMDDVEFVTSVSAEEANDIAEIHNTWRNLLNYQPHQQSLRKPWGQSERNIRHLRLKRKIDDRNIETEAKGIRDIRSFFTSAEEESKRGDDYGIEGIMSEDVVSDGSVDWEMHTDKVDEAIKKLTDETTLRRNKKAVAGEDCNFDSIQKLAVSDFCNLPPAPSLTSTFQVLRYLELRKRGLGKLDASVTIAELLYNKASKFSYKSQCIRNWAQYYIKNDCFPDYKAGLHAKTYSIIFDEKVQILLKKRLADMEAKNRTPYLFMCELNETILREIPVAPEKVSESFRFMSGYRLGFKGPLLDYIMKKYTSHRLIPSSILREQVDREFADAQQAKLMKTEAKSFTTNYAVASEELLAPAIEVVPDLVPRDLPDDFGEAEFIASDVFAGSRAGYVFKRSGSIDVPGHVGYCRES